MASYSLSGRAAADVAEIFEYSIANFGLTKARDYLEGLHQRFVMLGNNPRYGQRADELSPGLRRTPYGSHVVFYVYRPGRVFVVRILHQGMDAESGLSDPGR